MNSFRRLLLAAMVFWTQGQVAQEDVSRTFDPAEIQVRMNPEVDVVYHVLAHFSVPGDPSNLYSADYLSQIKQGKQDLGSGPTRLDGERSELENIYRRFPHLRFLNLALFMADDYASFKQALLSIDTDVEKEESASNQDTLEARKAREKDSPLLFGNAKRLIPLYRKRFPDMAERQFVKRFAECMDEEYRLFYRPYREARVELDQASFEEFMSLWRSQGLKMLTPWAARSRATVFNVYLSPVIKNNGRAIPVNQEQRVDFNVVAPLPETKDQVFGAFLVVLHETTRRVTDGELDKASSTMGSLEDSLRDKAVFLC